MASGGLPDLTVWEKAHLKDILLLWKQAEAAIVAFRVKEKANEDADVSQDWLNFRSIVSSLYSVLDYTYYLLWCHLSNGGDRAPHKEAIKLGFPYKAQGVKTSETPSHDGTQKFVDQKAQQLCRGNPAAAEGICRFLLSLQPKLKVTPNGDPEGDPEVSGPDAEWMAMLYYYRNCVTHRDLIRFLPETLWVECSDAAAGYKLVKDPKRRNGAFHYPLEGKHFAIELPDNIKGRERLMLLWHVLEGMRELVRNIYTELLRLAGIPLQELPDDSQRKQTPSGNGGKPSGNGEMSIESQNVYDREGYLMLFRSYVSKKAAGNGKALLEFLGFDAATVEACFWGVKKEEEAVQNGLIKWAGGGQGKPPIWRVLLEAMAKAEIERPHIQKLKEKLGLC